mgnify:CR=1 FL=1
MKELETRIIDIDVDGIREKLKSLGAEKVKEEYQTNIYMILKIIDY